MSKLRTKENLRDRILFGFQILSSAEGILSKFPDEHLDLFEDIDDYAKAAQMCGNLISTACFNALHCYREESSYQFSGPDEIYLKAATIYNKVASQLTEDLMELQGLPITISRGKKELLFVEAADHLTDQLYHLYFEESILHK